MHHIDLNTLTLAKGAHDDRSNGLCLLEAVAWWADERHSDHPECVSPVLGAFGRSLNDVLPDEKRRGLVRFVPLLPGTAGDGQDEARGYVALDWLIRTYTPAWLDLAGLAEEAVALRDLRRIVDLVAAQSAGPVMRQASEKAAAARAAARAAAWDAAWDAAGAAARAAAWDAAWDAAGAAAWDAARAAARAAAWDAAWDAAGAAARAAARAAAWDAAWDAAGAAAWDAARDAAGAAARAAAWDAAWDAARAKLAPTVTVLQDSAIALYEAMIHPGSLTDPALD